MDNFCIVPPMHSASDKNLVHSRLTEWRIVERLLAISYCSGYGQEAGFCENCDDPSGFSKCGKCLEQLSNY